MHFSSSCISDSQLDFRVDFYGVVFPILNLILSTCILVSIFKSMYHFRVLHAHGYIVYTCDGAPLSQGCSTRCDHDG